MSWAADPNSVMDMLAIYMAERVFKDLIADGVGTREQFAQVYLIYNRSRPGVGMEQTAQELRRLLDTWLKERTFASIVEQAEREEKERLALPPSSGITTN